MAVDPSKLKAAASADVAKAEAWLGSNWYPFSIGAGAMLFVVVVLHFLFKVL